MILNTDTTNDIELTKMRQERIAEQGILKGLPVFCIIDYKWNTIKLFSNKSNAESYYNYYKELMDHDEIEFKLEYIEDVLSYSFELEKKEYGAPTLK